MTTSGADPGVKTLLTHPSTQTPAVAAMGASSSTAAPPLNKRSTAKEVLAHYAGGNASYLAGKTAVVTGGNSGIGCQTVKALASAGCRVILASRSVKAGEDAIIEQCEQDVGDGYAVPNARSLITVRQLDLASLESVKAFAAALAEEPHIDFLVENAGVMALPKREETTDGFERQVGTNHFGHFYLVQLLREKLVAQNSPVRIVVVSSEAHKMSSLATVKDTEDLHFKGPRQYSAWGAYGQSKLANLLFAKSLADQLADTKVVAVSLHPGIIATNLQRSSE